MKGFDALPESSSPAARPPRGEDGYLERRAIPISSNSSTAKPMKRRRHGCCWINGYAGGVDGEAYSSIFFQNANHSVRVTDEFMQAVVNDGDWSTRSIVTGEIVDTYKARELMRMISDSAYICGDPGMQYDTTVNRWHTSKNTAPITHRIHVRNTCSRRLGVQPGVFEPDEIRG
jgi:ribonucleoside-diphosphate reductase alpha chain